MNIFYLLTDHAIIFLLINCVFQLCRLHVTISCLFAHAQFKINFLSRSSCYVLLSMNNNGPYQPILQWFRRVSYWKDTVVKLSNAGSLFLRSINQNFQNNIISQVILNKMYSNLCSKVIAFLGACLYKRSFVSVTMLRRPY